MSAMELLLRLPLLSICLLASSLTSFSAEILDTITFGDTNSESAHQFSEIRSERIVGGLGKRARRLLPLDPASYNGGSMTFKLKVDPEQQNYFTAKLWGSDKDEERGRLILYIDGLQVGYRHEGDHDVLNQTDNEAIFQGRFLYQTVALPPLHTKGKTKVELKIEGLGRMWSYGSSFAQKQRSLTKPTRGIYRVYTHTNKRFMPDPSEKQGEAVTPKVRPGGPGEELLTQMKVTVNNRLERLLGVSGDEAPSQEDMLLLAEAYHTSWTVAHRDDRVIAAIIRGGDTYVRNANLDPRNWMGAGPFGEAIARIGSNPGLMKALDEEIQVPAQLRGFRRRDRNGEGSTSENSTDMVRITRREAWARVLRASVDGHRTRGRRSYTNQSMIVDYNIYAANRGLLVIDPTEALAEKVALRYIYESIGLLPWLGNDSNDGGSEKPYGTNYFLITQKGLSRELGYVGSYGETILKFCRDMAHLTGDQKIRQQLIKIQSSRMWFRYPSLDPDGYRQMKIVSEIDNRTAHFSMSNGAYTAADVREAWWMEVPALTKDPVSVGAAQQCLDDNQYFYRLAQRANDRNTVGMMRNIDEYASVKALPKSAFRLPMTDGQPDFVFSDEKNAVIAMKHGDQMLFLNFYFRQEFGVSGVVRVFDVTPTVMRIASVLADFEVISSGEEWTRPDIIDFERSGGFPPPDNEIHQAWQGEKLPIAKRPVDASRPSYGEWGPFVGKAAFYSLRYGDYLFAINTTSDSTFKLNTPADEREAINLVTGRTIRLAEPLTVGPLTTLVLRFGDDHDTIIH